MAGDSPVAVLKGQILKYQFPSSFSLSRGVCVSTRFRIRPFRFLLRLLRDSRIMYLTEEEIAKVVMVEADSESESCYEKTAAKIQMFRSEGDASLDPDFFEKYAPSKGGVNPDNPYGNLKDIANTMVNWLEYTQLAKRDDSRRLRILPDKLDEAAAILSRTPPFIDRPEQHEYFQRKFGLDPKHRKDTRSLSGSQTITAKMIAEQKIKQIFIGESLKKPIKRITSDMIDMIAVRTGFDSKAVEEILFKLYPHGAVGAFLAEYFEMAFKGRDEAAEFEKATAELFRVVLGFEAQHVGPAGLTPDVLLLSDSAGYSAIIDNKAYSRYTISNDHHNRMVHNYICGIGRYYSGRLPLAFFAYIAGGFGNSISAQIQSIVSETSVHGSAVSVSNVIRFVERCEENGYTHDAVRKLFSLDRQILLSDLP